MLNLQTQKLTTTWLEHSTLVPHAVKPHRTSQIHRGLRWQDADHREKMLRRQLAAKQHFI